MNRSIIEIPTTPSDESINNLTGLNTISQTFDKKYCKLYTFDEEYKRGSIVKTKLQLPLINLNEGDKEIFVFRGSFYFLQETQIRYKAVFDKEYFIILHLSCDTDFKEFSEQQNMSYKKGQWTLLWLNTGTTIRNLLFSQRTHIKIICTYIPVASLTYFRNVLADFYLKRLVDAEESYFAYEATSSRLRPLIESIHGNKMESFLEMITFQEGIYAILRTTFENLSQNSTKHIQHNFKKNDLEALAKAEQLLLRNIQEPPTIQALANEAAMSPTKFKSAFKKIYGESVYQYYLNQRMQLAHQWMLENKLNITEIAKQLGYKNLAHFSRIFKKHFGKLPSKYK